MDDKVEKPSVKAARALKPYFTNSVDAAVSIGILPVTIDNIAALIEEEMSRAVSPSPTNKDSATENVEAQEEVVSALWEFARNQRDNAPNAAESGAAPYVHLNSVGQALKRIMAAFKYEVASIE